MRLFGFEVTRAKAAQQLNAIESRGGWWNVIREPFTGAWQRNVEIAAPRDLLAFSGLFACVTGIAGDISKLRIKLVQEDADGICTELENSPKLPVLRKPNPWQSRIQFLEQWMISKLLYGNTYALKVQDERPLVSRLYILDAQRVTPLVAVNGDVYYRLNLDYLSGLDAEVTVPSSEIIHDRWNCLWHPLVGVSPIYACAVSGTQGRKIQANSTQFFENMSRPSGMLSAPGAITDELAARIKEQWETNFSGSNIGRLAVLGDGLKYEAMTIPAEAAQLIEQLKFTVEDVARCFHYPNFKVGGAVPPQTSIEALNQAYYTDCLQVLIEAFELCMDEGLMLARGQYTELDLDGLLRMDTAARYDATGKAVASGWMSPNEARARENMKPVKGGESPMIQQQNYSLEALAKRDAKEDPFAGAAPKPKPEPDPDEDEDEVDDVAEAAALLDYIAKGLACETK